MSGLQNLTFESITPTQTTPRDNAWGEPTGTLLNNVDNLSNALLHLSGADSSDPFKSKLSKPEILLASFRNKSGYKKAQDLAEGGLQKITSLADNFSNPRKNKTFPRIAAKKIFTESYNMLDPKNEVGSFYRGELQEFSKQLGLGNIKDLREFRTGGSAGRNNIDQPSR